MYEETTGVHVEQGGDSSEDDDKEQKEPPPEPTRFGWVQGVMVGGVLPVFSAFDSPESQLIWLKMGSILSLSQPVCLFVAVI